MITHTLTTCKNHCWHQAKPAYCEGAVRVLLVTSMSMGAGLSLRKRFSSPSDIFPLCYFALNIVKRSQLLQVAPLWTESAVSLVYFGHNGCALLYYCSPQLVYVLFLDSLCASTRGGAEAKCDPQMSRISPVPPLCSTADLRSWLRKAILVPWAAAILPGGRPCAMLLYADQKWPSDAWQVASTVLSWAISGSSCMLFIAITTGQALRSLVCLSDYNQSRRVQFSEVSAWAISVYLLEGSGSIKRNHSALLSPVSCITFGRSESTMVSLYLIYCLKKGMRLEWERCWMPLLPDWRGMYFLSCRTIVQSEEMVQITWHIGHKNKFCTHNSLLMWQITSW